jgi:nicotinamide-nucleotide adenylyltransferase
MFKYKVGLVVGRFQPFHKGHLYLIKKALTIADKIIIAVGSSNIKDGDNPVSYEARVKILNDVLAHENLKEKVLKIVPSPDHPSDEEWLKLLFKSTGKFDAEIGNNDWVNRILSGAGYNVVKIPYFKRDLYQGVFIRELYNEGNPWEDRVPSYLSESIKEEFDKSLK